MFFVCYIVNGLCDELITHSEESYGGCVCLVVCDQETPARRWPRPKFGYCAKKKNAVCPFVCMEQIGFHGKDFHEI